MKAAVDQDACIGCGICPDVCAAVFKMIGEKAVAQLELVPPEEEETARDAARQCPVDAIKLTPA